jgi:hypothetical protein
MKQTIILMIAAITVVSQQPSYAGPDNVQSSVEALGTTEGKPITNGFVFIDGKYIAPPYVVSREGNGIFINDHLVEQPCPWPIPQKKKPTFPTEDPKMPNSITDKSSMYDAVLTEYMDKKRAYHASRLHGKEFAEIMIKAYAELPCVQEAKQGRDFKHVDVIWKNGRVDHIRIVPFTRKPMEWTRETVLERTERDRSNYEDRLNKGDYYFLGSAHGRMTGTVEGARKLLGALLPILKTSKDAKEVQQRLQQLGISFMDEKACEVFFKNRTDSTELDERVDALVKGKKE